MSMDVFCTIVERILDIHYPELVASYSAAVLSEVARGVPDPHPPTGVPRLRAPVRVQDLDRAVRVDPPLGGRAVLLHLAVGQLYPPVPVNLD